MKIDNEQLLTSRFGEWPSFHDAEIVSAQFQRQGTDAPLLECDIHVYQMTKEIDPAGYYVTKNHTLATLRFVDIDLEDFTGWNEQNVISDFTLKNNPDNGDRPIQVEIHSSYGCSINLRCRGVKVIRAEEMKQDSQPAR